jgi:biopolymer transport protein ExbD
MRIRRDDDGGMADDDVPMTPLIDAVFLLLIFFIVTASLKKPVREWDLDLAADSYGVSSKFRNNEIIISVTPKGQLHLYDGSQTIENVSKTELAKVLGHAGEAPARGEERPHVRIDADRNVKMFQVAEVVDLLANYQLHDISFRAKDRK